MAPPPGPLGASPLCVVPSLSLDDKAARGQILRLAKTQAGSRYLQEQLRTGHSGLAELIVDEVEARVVDLICDAYGNYLCSTAFLICSLPRRRQMLLNLAPFTAAIARDKRGSHAFEALISALNTPEEQSLFAAAVAGRAVELAMDPNATHVVQRMLVRFAPACSGEVCKEIVANVRELANHATGVEVLKSCISSVAPQGPQKEALIAALASHALALVQSQYGNYAVQRALEEWGADCSQPIFEGLQDWRVYLSMKKFSSNVVEKLFCFSSPELRARFINELIDSERLPKLVNSNYGHYVVKRVAQLAEPPQVCALLQAIRGPVGQLTSRRLRAQWADVVTTGRGRLDDICADAIGCCSVHTCGAYVDSAAKRPKGGANKIATYASAHSR